MKKSRILSILLALCLACSLLVPTAAAAGAFVDVPADAYYKDAVDWAVTRGITDGTTRRFRRTQAAPARRWSRFCGA